MSSGWHKEDIKVAIRKRGVTMEALSLANGLHVNACTMALIRPSIHAERVITEFLNISPLQLWPQRFEADGRHRDGRRNRDNTRRRTDGERQKESVRRTSPAPHSTHRNGDAS